VNKLILAIICLVLMLTSCTEHRPLPTTESSPYCEDSAMAHFLTQPERALLLLDSAVITEQLTPQRAQYLKAVVYYNGLDRSDSCMALCQRLVDQQVWESSADADEARSMQVDLYRVMALAAQDLDNQLAVVRYAKQGAQIAHGDANLVGEEADLLSRSGLVMFQTGQTEEGLETMRRAEQLALNSDSWQSLLAYLNNAKKLGVALNTKGCYAESKEVILKALERLEAFGQQPKSCPNTPEAILSDSAALAEFLDYYRVPYYAYLTSICCDEGDSKEALEWLARHDAVSDRTSEAQSQPIIHPLILLGRYDEARQHIEALKQTIGFDNDRVGLLREEMLLAQQTGDILTVAQVAGQIIDITDSLSQHKYQMLLAEASTQFQLQEERQRRKDSEDRLVIMSGGAILMVCAIVLFFGALFIRRQTARRKRLDNELREAQTQIEALRKEQPADKLKQISTEELYKRALFVMEQYEPYRKPDFDLDRLAEQVFSNRTYLSSAINQIAGMNFRSWLAQFRVEYAKRMITEHPDIAADELLMQCGFDNRQSFYRQFRAITGMTPSEWGAQRIEQNAIDTTDDDS